MLVLSRQRDEYLDLLLGGEVVSIQVVDIRGDKVRLGITAPDAAPVMRREILTSLGATDAAARAALLAELGRKAGRMHAASTPAESTATEAA